MPHIQAISVANLLGLKAGKRASFTHLDLAEAVQKGLPVSTVERVLHRIAPGDRRFRDRFIPRATLARREKSLSPLESDRLARLARLWAFAVDVWGSDAEALRFLAEPHPILEGRVPRDVAVETEIGARAVEDLLGRLKYGSAA
jgi:putative toxin-antitoxin system antitoxin component (TIGR02293 family)